MFLFNYVTHGLVGWVVVWDSTCTFLSFKCVFCPSRPWMVFIGYWLDMEIYVRVLVRSNIARRQERNINYAPERIKISKITSVLNKQKLIFRTKVKQLLPLPFLRLSRNMNVYS